MKQGTITKAIEFATKAHGTQVRKYTDEPYITHPIAVATLVNDFVVKPTQEQVVAGILHDTVEDTPTTIKDIELIFGEVVAKYVFWLTDVSKPTDGNRKHRKELDRKHISKSPPEVKTIKLADLIHNTHSIKEHDPKFAKIYFAEKLLLLEVLSEGDKVLFEKAKKLVDEYYKRD